MPRKYKEQWRHAWDAVDWSQSNAEIARQLGCHRDAVRQQRARRDGKVLHRKWAPEPKQR